MHHPRIMLRLKRYVWRYKKYCNYQQRRTWNTNHTKHRYKIVPHRVVGTTIITTRVPPPEMPGSLPPQQHLLQRLAHIITTIIIIRHRHHRHDVRVRGPNGTRPTTRVATWWERNIITIKILRVVPHHVGRGGTNPLNCASKSYRM